jgi:hypothetical protein
MAKEKRGIELAATKIAVFKGKQIRKAIHNNEWWFSVIDVCGILTDSPDPGAYWRKLKQRLIEEGSEVVTFCHGLKLTAPDGKSRETDCSKAEPFKRWLAKVGYDRVQEVENPELAMARMRAIYEQKGYPKGWIDKRIRGIAVRQDLTKEWDARGAETDVQYAILTNDIMEAAFGLKVDDYKNFKGLKRENLRDHMNDIELILTMLGEATTTKLTRDRATRGFPKLRKDAKDGGAVAGRTRKDIEMRSGKPVISAGNFLELEKKKSLPR